VAVSNTGNSRATGVMLNVQLPKYDADTGSQILGDLGAIDSRCRVRGTRLQCLLGQLDANATTTIGFDLALPQTDDTLGITARVSATSAETVLTNNLANRPVVLLDYAVDIGEEGLGTVEHCMGTDLESFFECIDGEDALAEYDLGFLDTGKVSLPDRPDYTGLWTQVPEGKNEADPHYLRFEIADQEGTQVVFEGYGASDACFEGVAIYRGLDAVAGYRVCL
jgi:hypothetical protein